MSQVTVSLEDRLNSCLEGTSFGSDLTLFVIIFVTAFDDPEENRRWAKGHTKLGRSHPDEHGGRARMATVGVPVDRAEVKYLTGGSLARILVRAAAASVREKPAKTAQGLQWQKLAEAVTAALDEEALSAV